MSVISGRIYLKKVNKIVKIEPHLFNGDSISLLENEEFGIAIDQSSTCTGIAVQNMDRTVTMIFDLQRDSLDKESFYRDVKMFLLNMIKTASIKFFVCEHPYNTKNQKYSSTVLLELLGKVESWAAEWKYERPFFRDTKIDKIYPQTWKSIVVDKSKGTKRGNNKRCIAEDLCDRYPQFSEYMIAHVSKDYDAFDALGILEGYRTLAYTPEGIPQIFSIIEKRHTSLVCYRYVDKEMLHSLDEATDFLGEARSLFNPVFKMYNPFKDEFDNIRMASSSEKFTVSIWPESLLTALQWKFDFELDDNKIMLVYILNKGRFTKHEIDCIKEDLPWNEEKVSM